MYNGPPEAANAQPATVDTTPPGVEAAPAAPNFPTDVTTLAVSIAASAGPDIAAQVGPDGFMAAATDWLQRVQGAAAPHAAAPSEAPEAASSGGSAQPSPSGRKLQQTAVFNFRQDVLVLYSEAGARAAGGVTSIQNMIRARVVESNKVGHKAQPEGLNVPLACGMPTPTLSVQV